MLGAGVFYVWKPAWELAGVWMLASLAIAALVATLNGLVTAQLAIQVPVSGGIYSYGRRYRGDFTGFLAGWFFLTGKTASAAAISLIAASYLAPDHARVLAAGFIGLFTVVVIAGIRHTATVSIAIASIVVLGLTAVSVTSLVSRPVDVTWSGEPGWGILTAAGVMFFAFAGYARMATLGEEVRDPTRTLPRAIVIALLVVLAVYGLVAWALLGPLSQFGAPADPLTLLVPDSARVLVVTLAVLAGLGSLLAILAGLSRTSLQMARHRDLPGVLSHISPRTEGPLVSEVAVGIAALVLVVATDPLWLVGLSGAGVLSYYAIGHWSAIAQPAPERVLPRFVPIIGLGLCALLVVSLPPLSLFAGAIWALLGALWFVLTRRLRRRRQSAPA